MEINWTGEPHAIWQERIQQAGPARVQNVLRQAGIPARLAEALSEDANVRDQQVAQLKKAEVEQLIGKLTQFSLTCTGHEGYAKAEVTGGGVKLNEVDCASMESRVLPKVYLCGELLDIFGRIGGFNFYWAWLSGRLAGSAAARR